ncbi:non-canonical purine NTP diphosphatase [Salinimicrobium xinjiangense]|uniref:non-canonical purine NTP diphosphatase n=1 Tax=Salinimicrobium xinjiangense TaxID=438596 RepID=UPI000423F278|nr:non-canonical purine NTP diphosphatase [Salinimicrobium xinjiangense]
MKLVFATNNKNKIKEVQALLPKEIQLLSLEEIGCTEDIPETSPTIEGNAIQKAEYVKQKYGYDCFADDTGLEVEALDGAPGVYSARYAGEVKSSDANINKLLKELEGEEDRSARFKTVIALHLNGELHTFTGICSGNIIFERKGLQGFGYDPVFQPEGKTLTFAEMSLREKSEISHRALATRQLIDFLTSYRPQI